MSQPDFVVGAQVFADMQQCALAARQKIQCKGFSMTLEDGFVIRASPHLDPKAIVAETPRAMLAFNTIVLKGMTNEDEDDNEFVIDIEPTDL